MEKRQSCRDIWVRTLGRLQIQLPRETFNTWLKDAHLLSEEDGLFVIGVPDAYTQNWLEKRLHKQIHRTLREVAKREVDIRYVLSTPQDPPSEESTKPMPLWSEGNVPIADENTFHDSFRDIIIGECNRLAYAVSLSVTEHLLKNRTASPYNPLVLYGGSGVGKTHLLRAMYQSVSAHGMRSLYTTVEEFTNQFISSIRAQTTDKFRERYRSLDLLLMDDIQFLTGKENTLEEFFHTIDTLQSAGAQLVVAGDRHPNEIPGISERLRSRLNGGLPVELHPPDAKTKKELLIKMSEERGVYLQEDVIHAIARNIVGGVWEVQGAFNRVAAYAEFLHKPITAGVLDQVLAPFLTAGTSVRLSPDRVLEAVASFYEVPENEMKGQSRKRSVVQARHVAIYLMREDLGLSLAQIGKILGGRDHTTVRYAYRKIKSTAETNLALRRHLSDIRDALRVSGKHNAPTSGERERTDAVAEAEAIMTVAGERNERTTAVDVTMAPRLAVKSRLE